MNYFAKSQVTKWALFVVIVLNIVLLSILFWNNSSSKGPHEGKHHRKGSPREMIIEELEFSQEQIDLYDGLIKEHRSQVGAIKKKMSAAKFDLFEALKRPDSDSINIKPLTGTIGNLQVEMETVTFQHFAKVRKICTPDQQKNFDTIIQDVMKKFRGPHKGPKGHHPPRDRR